MKKFLLLGVILFCWGCMMNTEQKTGNTNRMAETGWVWEGLAFDPGVQPTIYGVGEGTKYFGLDKANFIFHPNTSFIFSGNSFNNS